MGLVFDLGDAVELGGQGGPGVRGDRRVIHPRRLQRATAIVDAGVDVDHVEPRLDEFDRRQELGALQSVLPQQVGMVVRCHAQHHALVEQVQQQAAQDHRVGDVVDVELVEADQAVFFGDVLGEDPERILLALEFIKRLVHVAHEVMEMHAPLLDQRHAQVKAVHQEALAAPDAAPQIEPSRQFGVDEHAPERGAAAHLVADPLVVQFLHARHCRLLCLVTDVAAARDDAIVVIDDVELALFGGRVDVVDRLVVGFVRAVAHGNQMWIERFSTPSIASFMTSDNEGWAWQVRATSSEVAMNSIASTASAICSDACA